MRAIGRMIRDMDKASTPIYSPGNLIKGIGVTGRRKGKVNLPSPMGITMMGSSLIILKMEMESFIISQELSLMENG